ncbi:hypothetical protein ACP70R_049589 [Stipagrostis hirtigluma subsp. patula]
MMAATSIAGNLDLNQPFDPTGTGMMAATSIADDLDLRSRSGDGSSDRREQTPFPKSR